MMKKRIATTSAITSGIAIALILSGYAGGIGGPGQSEAAFAVSPETRLLSDSPFHSDVSLKGTAEEQDLDAVGSDQFGVSVTVNPETRLFSGSYSYASISVKGTIEGREFAFAKLPNSVAPDSHVQRVFEKAPIQLDKHSVNFDIFFPLFESTRDIPIKFFPAGTTFEDGEASTEGVTYHLNVETNSRGSAFLLGQEDKMQNARVAALGSAEAKKPAEYTWYGRTEPDLNAPRVDKAVVHITQLLGSSLVDRSTFQLDGKELPIYRDPSRCDKGHVYAFTNAHGEAKIRVTPPAKPIGGELIYWPFANTASEVAQIVYYSADKFGPNLHEAVPVQNPTHVTEHDSRTHTSFTIDNRDRTIKPGGRLYLIVNDRFDSVVPSSGRPSITVSPSNLFAVGSATHFPAANNLRYIYISTKEIVQTSRKFAFFAFK